MSKIGVYASVRSGFIRSLPSRKSLDQAERKRATERLPSLPGATPDPISIAPIHRLVVGSFVKHNMWEGMMK